MYQNSGLKLGQKFLGFLLYNKWIIRICYKLMEKWQDYKEKLKCMTIKRN